MYLFHGLKRLFSERKSGNIPIDQNRLILEKFASTRQKNFDFSGTAEKIVTISILETSFLFLGIMTGNKDVLRYINGHQHTILLWAFFFFYVAIVISLPSLIARKRGTERQRRFYKRLEYLSVLSLMLGNFLFALFFIDFLKHFMSLTRH